MRASTLLCTLGLTASVLAVPDGEAESSGTGTTASPVQTGHHQPLAERDVPIDYISQWYSEMNKPYPTLAEPLDWLTSNTEHWTTVYPAPTQASHPAIERDEESQALPTHVKPPPDFVSIINGSPASERFVPTSDVDKTPQHPPRREKPCNPLDPSCWSHDKRDEYPPGTLHVEEFCSFWNIPCWIEEALDDDSNQRRDINAARSLGRTASDWTRWACTRGVQWACQYPDFDERDVNEVDADPVTIAKRDSPIIPTKVGQVVTFERASQGQHYTGVLSLSQTNPVVYAATMHASGTSFTVVASQMTDDPNGVVETYIDPTTTFERTARMTASPTSIAGMTSMSFKKRWYTVNATPTPTVHLLKDKPKHEKEHKAKPHHAEHKAKSHHGSDSKRDDGALGVEDPRSFTPIRRDVDQVDTMTIVDEHPGHTTLNPEAGTQTSHANTKVTIVNHHGSKLTVFPTKDAEGHDILVTKGDPAKARETCTVTELVDENDIVETIMPAKTGEHMVTKTTRISRRPWTPKVAIPTQPPVSEAPIPKVEIPSTSSTVDAPIPKIAIAVTQYITKTVTMHPKLPNPTLMHVDWAPEYVHGQEDIMEMDLEDVKRLHPHADWEHTIPDLAKRVRHKHPDMSEEKSLKYAFVVLHRPPHHFHHPSPTDGASVVTHYNVDLSSTTVPMTAPSQTVAGHAYKIDPLAKYRAYDPVHNAVVPTGSCNHDENHNIDHVVEFFSGHPHVQNKFPQYRYNRTECHIERCMWNYMKPITIKTAIPALMRDEYDHRMMFDYFTHTTHLHRAHWGTTKSKGLYYPISTKSTARYAKPTVVRDPPRGMTEDDLDDQDAHGDPKCFDLESCHDLCFEQNRNVKNFDPEKWLPIVGGILGALLIAVLCCCCCMRRGDRHRRDPDRRKSSIADKLRRKPSEKPQEVVINQVTGESTDRNGNPVDPSTAVTTAAVAGSAAGAEAAANRRQSAAPGSGDDGRGTTGRRAEEGRGKVNFADGGKPGEEAKTGEEAKPAGEASSPSATERPAAERTVPEGGAPTTTEHAEPQPIPDKDGASASGVPTGRQQPDAASMRGRKRNRPEGIAGLGF